MFLKLFLATMQWYSIWTKLSLRVPKLNACLCHSYTSVVKGSSALPAEDRLMRFLVDTSTDAEETVQCANCDQESNKKVNVPSFYENQHTWWEEPSWKGLWWNTVTITKKFLKETLLISLFINLDVLFFAISEPRILGWCTTATRAANRCAAPAGSWRTEPGCSPTTRSCPWPNAPKPNTQSAVRATSRVHPSMRPCVHPSNPPVSTALHEEAYILFSTENKSLLCIKCFRDMQV